MTTSKLATERMRVSEMRYRRLFEAARDGILILNAKTLKITEVNPYMTELLGYSHDEFIGKELWEIGLFRDKAASKAAFKDLQKTGYLRYENLPLETTAGKRREVEFVSNVYDEDGTDVIQCNIRDITERKEYEAVRESLAAIVESSDDAIIGKDLHSVVTAWNSAAERIFGYTKDEMMGTTLLTLFPSDRTDEEVGILASIERGEVVEHLETVRLRKDGTAIDVSITTSPIRDGSGTVIGASKIVRDVTERIRAEARFRLAVESAPNAMVMADNDGKVILINAQTEVLFGYHRDELIGLPVETLVPERFRSAHPAHRKAFADDPQVRTMGAGRDLFGLRKDGSEVPVEIGLNPIEMEGGTYVLSSIVDITERKLAEARLRTAQERLSSALLAGSIGTWTWDIPNDVLVADEFVARTFSLDPSLAAAGLPVAEYFKAVFEDDKQTLSGQLGAAIESCGTYDLEYRVQRESGELQWIQAKGRVEGDAEGNALNFHGAVIDINDRKRIDGRFRRLIESNAQGVIFWNTSGEILEANDAFLDIVGYTRTDLDAGLINWAAMTPPEYAQSDRNSLKDMVERGFSSPAEKEFFRKDGSRVPILAGAATFEDNPDEGVCFVLDITDRNEIQQALRDSEEHFRFLNDLVEATRTLADAGQIMEVMSRMLGEYLRASRCAYADVDADGERFTVLHDYTDGCTSTAGRYDHLSHFGSKATETLNGGHTLIVRNVDAEMLPDDGADMFSAIGIKAIITCPLVKEGKLRAFMAVHQTTPRDWKAAEISIVQDVVERCWATIERRTAEETIYKLNADLEQRVTDRTAELAAANQELESFSYSVSHDLRAPLRHLNGFSLALLEDYSDKLDDVGKGYLQHVREASQEMGALIDDVLKLARVTRTEMHREQVDLSDLAADVIAKLREDAPERDVDIKIEQGLVATGDKRLLHILLTNLLGNAWKFTSNVTAAEISFGAEITEDGHSYFVRDNGAGFDMAYASKLFGAFQRLHTTSEFEGTGIGLATVQRIINRHGGRVWAAGTVGSGATFYFTLSKELENER